MYIVKKVFLFALVSIFLVSCGQKTVVDENTSSNTPAEQDKKIEKVLVTSSIIPLSSVINAVGGQYVEVNNIVPAGVSPHGFDLSAKQMVQVEKSEIVFLTGLENIDGFLEKAVEGKKQIHLADGIELLESTGHDHHDEDEHSDDEEEHEDHDHDAEHAHEEEHAHEDEHEDEHAHDKDPHVWLGKENIIMMSEKVRDELTAIMPEQAEYFAKNTADFKIELEEIYSDFASQTNGKTPKEFIVFHDAYNYLMQSVGMDLQLKVPFSENILHEIGTAHMADLVTEVQEHGVKQVFKEPQFSEGNLQKFVDQYSLELGTLDPLGTDSSANGYLNNIRSNLVALSKIYE